MKLLKYSILCIILQMVCSIGVIHGQESSPQLKKAIARLADKLSGRIWSKEVNELKRQINEFIIKYNNDTTELGNEISDLNDSILKYQNKVNNQQQIIKEKNINIEKLKYNCIQLHTELVEIQLRNYECDSLKRICEDSLAKEIKERKIYADSTAYWECQYDLCDSTLFEGRKICLDSTFKLLGKYKIGRGYYWIDLYQQKKLNPRNIVEIVILFTFCDDLLTDNDCHFSIIKDHEETAVCKEMSNRSLKVVKGHSKSTIEKKLCSNWFHKKEKYKLEFSIINYNSKSKYAKKIVKELSELMKNKGTFEF